MRVPADQASFAGQIFALPSKAPPQLAKRSDDARSPAHSRLLQARGQLHVESAPHLLCLSSCCSANPAGPEISLKTAASSSLFIEREAFDLTFESHCRFEFVRRVLPYCRALLRLLVLESRNDSAISSCTTVHCLLYHCRG